MASGYHSGQLGSREPGAGTKDVWNSEEDSRSTYPAGPVGTPEPTELLEPMKMF